MQAVISSWQNLVKIISKPENETIYSTSDHFWRLKFAKYFVQEMKKFCRWGRRQEGSTSRSKQRREKRALDFVQ